MIITLKNWYNLRRKMLKCEYVYRKEVISLILNAYTRVDAFLKEWTRSFFFFASTRVCGFEINELTSFLYTYSHSSILRLLCCQRAETHTYIKKCSCCVVSVLTACLQRADSMLVLCSCYARQHAVSTLTTAHVAKCVWRADALRIRAYSREYARIRRAYARIRRRDTFCVFVRRRKML